MGLIRKMKRTLGFNDESLKNRGTQGTAKVLSSTKTMLSDGEGSDGSPIYKCALLVTVAGAQPYEVTYKVENGLREGSEYPVYVDPKDPQNVYVERKTKTKEQVADTLSQLTGQSASGSGDSIQDALAQMQENARRWGSGKGGSKLG